MKFSKMVNTLRPTLPVILLAAMVFAPAAWAQSKYKTLHTFTGRPWPDLFAGVIFDQKGNLYGTTALGGVFGAGTAFSLTPNPDGSWTRSVLYSFCSVNHCADGISPTGLIFDQAGNLYGATARGGVVGGGTVFKLMPNQDGSWTENVLLNFCSVGICADGSQPAAGLIFDAAGNLYGTTQFGGPKDRGVVFQLTPNQDGSWTENVLYSFCSLANCSDGASPAAGLTRDATGSLYGTTLSGGGRTDFCGSGGCGTVFKLMPSGGGSWKEQVLHAFTGRDGAQLWAGVTFDQTGNLYGTTFFGTLPRTVCRLGCGNVFKLSPNSDGTWKESVLHTFKGGRDGASSLAGLIIDAGGNLYGTTLLGGSLSCGCGTVFKLSPNGKGGWRETTLHAFNDRPGVFPEAGVILDAAGNLYGTTVGDGTTTFGSVFEITQ